MDKTQLRDTVKEALREFYKIQARFRELEALAVELDKERLNLKEKASYLAGKMDAVASLNVFSEDELAEIRAEVDQEFSQQAGEGEQQPPVAPVNEVEATGE